MTELQMVSFALVCDCANTEGTRLEASSDTKSGLIIVTRVS